MFHKLLGSHIFFSRRRCLPEVTELTGGEGGRLITSGSLWPCRRSILAIPGLVRLFTSGNVANKSGTSLLFGGVWMWRRKYSYQLIRSFILESNILPLTEILVFHLVVLLPLLFPSANLVFRFPAESLIKPPTPSSASFVPFLIKQFCPIVPLRVVQ